MTAAEATAEIFLTAFRVLSKKEKETVAQKLLDDKAFREDLIDIVILEQRAKEPSRPIEAYLASKRKKKG